MLSFDSKKLSFGFITLTVCLVSVLAYRGVTRYINEVSFISKDAIFLITRGQGLKIISYRLKEEGVIQHDRLFILYVVSKGWQNALKAGEYRFQKGEALSQVASRIVRGDVISYSVTIPEGLNVLEVAGLLHDKNVIDRDDFLSLLNNEELRKELIGDNPIGYEGYLFPDTYFYNKGVVPEEFIRGMIKRFNTVYEGFGEERRRVHLSDNEILTLASIIEKETGDDSERPLISAVFHNRMKRRMRLESDPTVIYGLGSNSKGNLTKRDLATYTEYNTYLIRGLPPGPIANPGKESIAAALKPANVKYLYFVSKGDGTHQFSTNYESHRRAVYKYQR